MAFVFHRGLAIPLWTIALFTVALTALPTATLFLIAVGIAAIVFLMPSPIPWLRRSRALVRVFPSGHRDQATAAITMAAGTGVRTLDEPNRSTADDALDLLRMDDDGAGTWRDRRPNGSSPPDRL